VKEHVAWYSKNVRLDCLDVMHLVEQSSGSAVIQHV
jgi:hypothetical protein